MPCRFRSIQLFFFGLATAAGYAARTRADRACLTSKSRASNVVQFFYKRRDEQVSRGLRLIVHALRSSARSFEAFAEFANREYDFILHRGARVFLECSRGAPSASTHPIGSAESGSRRPSSGAIVHARPTPFFAILFLDGITKKSVVSGPFLIAAGRRRSDRWL